MREGWVSEWVSESGLYLSIVTTFSNTTDLPWDPLNKMQVCTQSDKYNVIETKFRCIRIDSTIRSWVFPTRKSKCIHPKICTQRSYLRIICPNMLCRRNGKRWRPQSDRLLYDAWICNLYLFYHMSLVGVQFFP